MNEENKWDHVQKRDLQRLLLSREFRDALPWELMYMDDWL